MTRRNKMAEIDDKYFYCTSCGERDEDLCDCFKCDYCNKNTEDYPCSYCDYDPDDEECECCGVKESLCQCTECEECGEMMDGGVCEFCMDESEGY
jgi:hypothetical protein